MNFKEFKEKYYNKDLTYIIENLLKEKDFFKSDKNTLSICLDVEDLVKEIEEYDETIPTLYIVKIRILLYNYILANLTAVRDTAFDEIFENYDFCVEEAIYTLSPQARFVKQLVEETLALKKQNVLNQLKNAIENISIQDEDLEKLQKAMNGLFKDKSPEEIKMIQDILAFNDPALKKMKDMMYDSAENLNLKNTKK